jgi:hypothetical protein
VTLDRAPWGNDEKVVPRFGQVQRYFNQPPNVGVATKNLFVSCTPTPTEIGYLFCLLSVKVKIVLIVYYERQTLAVPILCVDHHVGSGMPVPFHIFLILGERGAA